MLACSERFSRANGTNDHFPFVIFQFPFFILLGHERDKEARLGTLPLLTRGLLTLVANKMVNGRCQMTNVK